MNTDVSSLIADVRRQWTAATTALRPGVAETDVRAFEQRYGVQISTHLAEYFRTVDGMNDGESDEHFIRFWPLAEVRPAVQQLSEANQTVYEGYFVFADYSLWTHGYAVRLSSNGSDVAVVGGAAPIQVTPSFAAFLLTYLQHPDALFP